jgi:predicted metal-dependent hydrolase
MSDLIVRTREIDLSQDCGRHWLGGDAYLTALCFRPGFDPWRRAAKLVQQWLARNDASVRQSPPRQSSLLRI